MLAWVFLALLCITGLLCAIALFNGTHSSCEDCPTIFLCDGCEFQVKEDEPK